MRKRVTAFLISLATVVVCCSNEAVQEGERDSLDDGALALHGSRVDRYPPFVFQEWFPLTDRATYVFEGTYRDVTARTALTAVAHRTPFGVLYYFAERDEIEDPSPLLGANMFGLAGYLTTEDEVLTVQASHFDGFSDERAAFVQTLLRLPPRIGDVTEFRDGRSVITTTVEAREDLVVPAGRFEDCVRISITAKYPDADGLSTVWLAKNIGLVQWLRSTGRLDELVEYDQPGDGA